MRYRQRENDTIVWLILVIFLSGVISVFGQELVVSDFSTTNSVDARVYSYKDKNDETCALIKVASGVNDLLFDASQGVEHVEVKTGEYWVYVSPKERRLEIAKDGYPRLKYNLPTDIKPASVYEMKLEAQQPYNQQSANVGIDLTPGFMMLKTTPENAQVIINGQPSGITPMQKALPPGTYTLELKKDNYKTESRTFTLTEGQKIPLDVILQAAFGSLSVQTQPPGAEVEIDGNLQSGITPMIIDKLSEGSHKIVIKKKFFEPLVTQAVVNVSKINTVNYSLKPNFGGLYIDAPQGSIYVDNELVGQGHYEGKVEKGLHYIEARREGYDPVQKTLDVQVGKIEKVNLQFKASEGRLNLTTTPYEADVNVDGEFKGKTPLSFKLTTGTHQISLSKNGYKTKSFSLTIYKDKTLDYDETLELSDTYSQVPTSSRNLSSNPSNRSVEEDIETDPFYETFPGFYREDKYGNRIEETPDIYDYSGRPQAPSTNDEVSIAQNEVPINTSTDSGVGLKEDVKPVTDVSAADYFKPTRIGVVAASALMPGLGQHLAKGSSRLNWLYAGLVYGLGGYGLYNKYLADKQLEDLQSNTLSPLEYDTKYNEYSKNIDRSNKLLTAAGILWGVNVLHSMFVRIDGYHSPDYSISSASASLVVPGLGQILMGGSSANILYSALVGGSLYLGFKFHRDGLNKYDEYKNALRTQDRFDSSFSFGGFSFSSDKSEAESLYNEYEDLHNKSKIFIGLGVAIWGINVLDAFFSDAAVEGDYLSYEFENGTKLQFNQSYDFQNEGMTLGMNYSF